MKLGYLSNIFSHDVRIGLHVILAQRLIGPYKEYYDQSRLMSLIPQISVADSAYLKTNLQLIITNIY